MEHIEVILSNDAAFDRAVHENTVPDLGDLRIITKDNATKNGNPAAVITFTVQLETGKLQRVQTVTTINNLHAVLSAIEGKYGSHS